MAPLDHRKGRSKKEAPAGNAAGAFSLETIITAVAMPMMVMVAPAVMARTPSVVTMTTPAMPTVSAPTMTVMTTPAMVSAMMMVVAAPTVLDRNDTGLDRLGHGNGRSKRCRLNNTRCDAHEA